jgi:hypothetical protein
MLQEGGIRSVRLNSGVDCNRAANKRILQMRDFSQRGAEAASHLCYHARLRVGRCIWRGRRRTLFVTPIDRTYWSVYHPFRGWEDAPSVPFPARTNSRTSQNAVKAKFGRAPVRWARNSRVEAPLRVATACYIMVKRSLLGCGVSTPKRCCHAALGRLRLSSVGACYAELPRIPLLGTSVNKELFGRKPIVDSSWIHRRM